MNARIAEIGVETRKIWPKQGSRGLFVKKLNWQGLDSKKPGARTQINLKYKVYIGNRGLKDGGFHFKEAQGLKQKIKDFYAITFELWWSAG